jgi:hypothetical protein
MTCSIAKKAIFQDVLSVALEGCPAVSSEDFNGINLSQTT